MCRRNLCTLSCFGVLAAVALYFAGCQTPQLNNSPPAFWHQRDLEDVKLEFEARLSPNDGIRFEGHTFDRKMVVQNIKHNDLHMFEVVEQMKRHLTGMVVRKGGEVLGPIKESNKESGGIVRSFEFDYRRGRSMGVVRIEVRRHHLHREHFDLICQVTEHQPQTTF